MRDEDKPFVCFRQGRWSMKIVPRNGEGWRLLAMWLIGLILLTGLHIGAVASFEDNAQVVGWLSAGFVVLVIGWAVAMIRWMLPRSEVIQMEDVLAMKRERDRQKKDGRR